MKKVVTLAVIGIVWVQTAFAVLSGFYESLVELKTMLNDSRFAETFQTADTIQRIETIDSGFVVQTRDKEMKVDVIYQPQTHPGKQQFDLRFHRPTQIDTTR